MKIKDDITLKPWIVCISEILRDSFDAGLNVLLVTRTDPPCSFPHLHVVEDFEEGEGHAAADDHLIDLIQHVVDQLDLIFHLCSETKSARGGTHQNR